MHKRPTLLAWSGFFASPATMLPTFILIFPLLPVFVSLCSAASVTVTQNKDDPNTNCSAVCEPQAKECSHISCFCAPRYLQDLGDCELCLLPKTAQAQAQAQLALDRLMMACHDDGFEIDFQLQLPPDVQAVVDDVHRQNSRLRQYQSTFLGLQIAGGHVGLVIVLVFSIVFRKFRRDATFFNFCITWIISSIAYSVVLYRRSPGNTVASPLRHIPSLTCLTQAAFINGAQVMTACSTMSLVIQLWISLRIAIYSDQTYVIKHKKWTSLMLILIPYVLFLVFFIPSLVIGRGTILLKDFHTPVLRALPTAFYCTIVELDSFLRTVYGVTLVLLIVTVVFDVLIVTILYRHWRAFRNTDTTKAVSLSTLLRILVFSIYRVAVAVTYGTVLEKPPAPSVNTFIQKGGSVEDSATSGVPVWVDLLQAAIPLVAFIVLGINTDMFKSVVFWRKNHHDFDSGHDKPPVPPPKDDLLFKNPSEFNSWRSGSSSTALISRDGLAGGFAAASTKV